MANLAAQLLVMFQPVLLAGLTWVAVHVALYIRAHTKNVLLAGIFTRVNDAVWTAVKEIQQTLVDGMQAALKDDGVISDAEWIAVKATALAKVKSYLGPVGLLALTKALGLQTSAELDAWLGGKIEAAVHDLKASPSLAAASPS